MINSSQKTLPLNKRVFHFTGEWLMCPDTGSNGGAFHRLLLPHCRGRFTRDGKLDFFGNKVAFQTAGAEFHRKSRSADFGFYLHQIGLPGPAGMILGMAYLVAGNRVFSANIAGP
jgi:hypothetical protein